MIKKFLKFTIISALLATPAHAGEFYLSAGAGPVWSETDSGGDLGFHGSAGYRHKFFKVEAEYLNISREGYNVTQTASAPSPCYKIATCKPRSGGPVGRSERFSGTESVLLFNAYLVAPWESRIKPYIGAGGGDRRWQFLSGVEFELFDNVSLSGQYRYYNGESHAASGVLTFYFK